MIDKLKGTRDFYPQDWQKINFIREKCAKVSKKFGFEEYEAPIIEKAEIWLKKSGGEIPEQMYVFEDKNKELIALRPELTPSFARMIAKKQKELKKPIKWFSFPRVFRYEQPQSGRLREFFQYNADIVAADPIKAGAEIIALVIEMLKEFGLKENDFYVHINNRKLVDAILRKYNVENKEKVLQIIDKKDKLSEKEFIALLKEEKVDDSFLDIFNSDFINLELDEDGEKAKKELEQLFAILKPYSNYVKFDASIVRGLAYYTGIIFEVFDRDKKYRAIAGGGSYANLIESFDETAKLEGIGFGMGDVVLSLILEEKGLLPEYRKNVDYFIATIGNVYDVAFSLANKLREESVVEIDITGKGLSKQLDYANHINAKKLIIVGERDLKDNLITIKDLTTGKEEKIKLNDFI